MAQVFGEESYELNALITHAGSAMAQLKKLPGLYPDLFTNSQDQVVAVDEAMAARAVVASRWQQEVARHMVFMSKQRNVKGENLWDDYGAAGLVRIDTNSAFSKHTVPGQLNDRAWEEGIMRAILDMRFSDVLGLVRRDVFEAKGGQHAKPDNAAGQTTVTNTNNATSETNRTTTMPAVTETIPHTTTNKAPTHLLPEPLQQLNRQLMQNQQQMGRIESAMRDLRNRNPLGGEE